MEVSREDVPRCARLAHLDLAEAEIEPLRRDLEQLLTHAQSLDRLDLEGVEPCLPGQDLPLPRREDVARDGLTQAEALANGPQTGAGCFRVPKV